MMERVYLETKKLFGLNLNWIEYDFPVTMQDMNNIHCSQTRTKHNRASIH